MSLRVIVVERERFLRRGLERLLASTPGMVVSGCTETVQEAEALPAQTLGDVVLAGTDVADMQGTAGLDRLLMRFPLAQV